jgi:hypothetical protein
MGKNSGKKFLKKGVAHILKPKISQKKFFEKGCPI